MIKTVFDIVKTCHLSYYSATCVTFMPDVNSDTAYVLREV